MWFGKLKMKVELKINHKLTYNFCDIEKSTKKE